MSSSATSTDLPGEPLTKRHMQSELKRLMNTSKETKASETKEERYYRVLDTKYYRLFAKLSEALKDTYMAPIWIHNKETDGYRQFEKRVISKINDPSESKGSVALWMKGVAEAAEAEMASTEHGDWSGPKRAEYLLLDADWRFARAFSRTEWETKADVRLRDDVLNSALTWATEFIKAEELHDSQYGAGKAIVEDPLGESMSNDSKETIHGADSTASAKEE